jgi:hypothetical protein
MRRFIQHAGLFCLQPQTHLKEAAKASKQLDELMQEVHVNRLVVLACYASLTVAPSLAFASSNLQGDLGFFCSRSLKGYLEADVEWQRSVLISVLGALTKLLAATIAGAVGSFRTLLAAYPVEPSNLIRIYLTIFPPEASRLAQAAGAAAAAPALAAVNQSTRCAAAILERLLAAVPPHPGDAPFLRRSLRQLLLLCQVHRQSACCWCLAHPMPSLRPRYPSCLGVCGAQGSVWGPLAAPVIVPFLSASAAHLGFLGCRLWPSACLEGHKKQQMESAFLNGCPYRGPSQTKCGQTFSESRDCAATRRKPKSMKHSTLRRA